MTTPESPGLRSPRPSALRGASVLAALAIAAGAAAATWESVLPLPAAKGDAFGVVKGGLFHVIGGAPWQNGGDQDGSVFTGGPSGWSMTASLNGVGPVISQGGGVDSLGRIVVFGGLDPDSGDTGPTFVYDAIDGATTSLPARPASAPASGFAWCTDSQSRIYSLGGGKGAGFTSSAVCVRYSAATNSWSTLSPLPQAVSQAAAAWDGEGHLLVLGGWNANGSARSAKVQRFDVATGTWSMSAIPDMPAARSGAAAILGDDHRIYVMGGVDASGAVVSSTFVLDVWNNTWSLGPSMTAARERPAVLHGTDERIYVAGGRGAGGAALSSVERLATPPCPQITQQPISVDIWPGMSVGFSVAASGGPPRTYQWRRDGAALADGPLPSGGVVSGATTAALVIAGAGSADAGVFDVVVTTPCGSVTSDAVTFGVNVQPTLPRAWTAHVMHPSWANWSRLNAVRGDVAVGAAWKPFASFSMVAQPTVWSGTDAESAVNLAPPDSAGGELRDLDGGSFVGWWWWPFGCASGGQWYTCYNMEAASWDQDDGQHHNLQVSGWEFSQVTCASDGVKAGYVFTDDAGPDTYTFNAGLWAPPNDTFVALQPAGVWRSVVEGADGGRQFGWSFADGSFTAHAAGWSGSKSSWVDLNPPGAVRSLIYGAGGGQQVGVTGYVNLEHAGVWAGTAPAHTDLHPAGAVQSEAMGCGHGYQVGDVEEPGGLQHAVLWAGAADRMVDLHSSLPPGYNSSWASGVDVLPDGRVVVAGSAYHPDAGREEAILWISLPPNPADLDGDGDVTGADLGILLAAWGPCGGCAADITGDGWVDGADLGILLASWG